MNIIQENAVELIQGNTIFIFGLQITTVFALFIVCVTIGFLDIRNIERYTKKLIGLFLIITTIGTLISYSDQIKTETLLNEKRTEALKYYAELNPKNSICYVEKNYMRYLKRDEKRAIKSDLFQKMAKLGYELKTDSTDFYMFKKENQK